jgi:hypothetical protein
VDPRATRGLQPAPHDRTSRTGTVRISDCLPRRDFPPRRHAARDGAPLGELEDAARRRRTVALQDRPVSPRTRGSSPRSRSCAKAATAKAACASATTSRRLFDALGEPKHRSAESPRRAPTAACTAGLANGDRARVRDLKLVHDHPYGVHPRSCAGQTATTGAQVTPARYLDDLQCIGSRPVRKPCSTASSFVDPAPRARAQAEKGQLVVLTTAGRAVLPHGARRARAGVDVRPQGRGALTSTPSPPTTG